jgi:Glycosyl hydrolases family 16
MCFAGLALLSIIGCVFSEPSTAIQFAASRPTPVIVNPASLSIASGARQQLLAVTGLSNSAVVWSVSGEGCSGAACGTVTPNGLYIAPAEVPPSAIIRVTATSVVLPSRFGSAKITIVPPQAAGYGLAWEDRFSTLNPCTTYSGECDWYNPGLWYAAAAGSVTVPSGAYVDLRWTKDQSNKSTSITTASMDLKQYRAWTYGYFEISMAFSPKTGSWPGIAMYATTDGPGNATDNQLYAELDIFEWQSQNPNTFNGTVHVWKNGAFIASGYVTPTPAGIRYDRFNNYGVLWTPSTVSWYLNNEPMGTVSTASRPFNEVFNGQQPLYLALQQQAGCNWVYVCLGQTSPLDMRVQWVHIYQTPSQ